MNQDERKIKIFLIIIILFLLIFIGLLIDSIIKLNKNITYDDLIYYEGDYLYHRISKDSEGGSDVYKIFINGVKKPFTINNLVSNEVALRVLDLKEGEKIYFYVLDDKNYTVVEFGTNMPFITLEMYNKMVHKNALIGVITIPVISISLTTFLIISYIKYKKERGNNY